MWANFNVQHRTQGLSKSCRLTSQTFDCANCTAIMDYIIRIITMVEIEQ